MNDLVFGWFFELFPVLSQSKVYAIVELPGVFCGQFTFTSVSAKFMDRSIIVAVNLAISVAVLSKLHLK